MDAAGLRSFASRSAQGRFGLYGSNLRFRGVEVRGIVTSNDPTLTLGRGGFTEDCDWRIRLPGSITPPPENLDVIEELVEGVVIRTFSIAGVIPANPSNPNAQEHLCGAKLV